MLVRHPSIQINAKRASKVLLDGAREPLISDISQGDLIRPLWCSIDDLLSELNGLIWWKGDLRVSKFLFKPSFSVKDNH